MGALFRHELNRRFALTRSTKKAGLFVATIGIVVWSFQSVDITMAKIVRGIPALLDFISEIYPPDLSVAPTLLRSAVETVQMVIVGTLSGMILALPFAALASGNVAAKPVVAIARTLLMMVRTIRSPALASSSG